MLKSKPIGWITAGTLVCLAGVAVACRLRDGKEGASEANASPWSAKEESPPAAKLSPKGKIVAGKAAPTLAAPPKSETAFPPKPLAGEKTESIEATPPGPSEQTGEAKIPIVPLPGAPPAPAPCPAVTLIAGGEETPPAPPAQSVREPQTNLGMPKPAVVGDICAVKAESKPATEASIPPVPSTAETPEPKPETSEKKATPSPMPEKSSETPATPVAPVIPAKGAADIPAVKPPDEPVTSPAPPPVPATCPSSTQPSLLPTSKALGEPTYTVGDKGVTLREIAKWTLGNESRWTEIDQLNPDLRSESIVPAGKIVRLPADAQRILGGNVPGGAETQGMPPTKALPVRPLPVVRTKPVEAKAKVSVPLTGTYSCKLDDKRGLVLPKELCEQLDKAETVLLTPGPDQCLWLGTQASAARVLERVEKSGAAEQEVQTFRRLYYSQSEKAALDSSGKLAICEKLADYAGLGKEVVLIGIDDHFELWDAARWQRYSQHKDSAPKP